MPTSATPTSRAPISRRPCSTGVDLSQATTTDIEQGGGTHSASEDESADKPELLHIDDPSVASHGDKGATAFLWDNAEDAEKSRLRVAVARPDVEFDGRAPALPIPSDLVLSSGIAAHKDGFATVALVERPGGVIASITTVDGHGKLVATASLKLGYTPAAKPVFRSEGGLLHIYGISREGPGIQIHRWEGGSELVAIHASRMPTARGFTSNRYPVLLTKGGIVAMVSTAGVGKPVRVPSTFPGRLCATCPIEGNGVGFAWLGRDELGLRFAAGLPEQAPEEERLLPKQAIGVLDINPTPDGAWVVFTQESSKASAPATAWAVQLPGGKPFRAPRGRGRRRDGRALRGRRPRRGREHARRLGLRDPALGRRLEARLEDWRLARRSGTAGGDRRSETRLSRTVGRRPRTLCPLGGVACRLVGGSSCSCSSRRRWPVDISRASTLRPSPCARRRRAPSGWRPPRGTPTRRLAPRSDRRRRSAPRSPRVSPSIVPSPGARRAWPGARRRRARGPSSVPSIGSGRGLARCSDVPPTGPERARIGHMDSVYSIASTAPGSSPSIRARVVPPKCAASHAGRSGAGHPREPARRRTPRDRVNVTWTEPAKPVGVLQPARILSGKRGRSAAAT